MVEIGKHNTLTVLREAKSGVYLDGGELGEILLPNRYVPKRTMPGDRVDVFVYRDSEDRLVATTETPRGTVGDIVTLRVVGVNRQVGAFLDWGLAKDLLLPFREQTRPVKPGDEVPVHIYLDPKTRRIVASMKFDKIREAEPAPLRAGQNVEFTITEKTSLGYKALVEGSHLGLLYHENLSAPITLGQKLTGYVRTVRADGKLDLSLDESGYQRVGPLAERILQALRNGNGRLDIDDDTLPEKVRHMFGVSKKAFKQALGALFKRRRIRFTNPGIELLDSVEWSPGTESRARSKRANGPKRQQSSRRQ